LKLSRAARWAFVKPRCGCCAEQGIEHTLPAVIAIESPLGSPLGIVIAIESPLGIVIVIESPLGSPLGSKVFCIANRRFISILHFHCTIRFGGL